MSVIFRAQGAGGPSGGSAAKIRTRIIIAEDQQTYSRMLRTLLEPECEILAAVIDGRALVEAWRAFRPDVIVTDIDMPVMTGIEAARAILSQQPHARIVFLTAHDDAAIVKYALELGALGYVSKYDAPRELHDAIRVTLSGAPYISSRCWNVLGRSVHPGKRWSDDPQ